MIPNSKLDPRSKLSMVMSLSGMGVLINDIRIMIGILFITIIILKLLKVSILKILRKFKRILYMIVVLVIVQSIFFKGGNPIIAVGSVAIISDMGLQKAAAFALRIGIVIASASILTTSSYRDIVQGLVQWKMPYEIAFMVSVAIRFLPTFMEEFKDASVALQLRGVDFEKIPVKKKLTVYSYLFFPVVSNAILKAQELSIAMETRAFRAYPFRTSYLILKIKPLDYIIIAVSFFTAVAGITLYYT